MIHNLDLCVYTMCKDIHTYVVSPIGGQSGSCPWPTLVSHVTTYLSDGWGRSACNAPWGWSYLAVVTLPCWRMDLSPSLSVWMALLTCRTLGERVLGHHFEQSGDAFPVPDLPILTALCGPTNGISTQNIKACGSFTLDLKQWKYSLWLWDIDFQLNCCIYLHLKSGLWATDQQSCHFSHLLTFE